MRLLLLLTIFGLLMVIATVPEVRATSIKCFKCNSDKDKNCKDKTRLTATVSCKVGCFEATLQCNASTKKIVGIKKIITLLLFQMKPSRPLLEDVMKKTNDMI